MNSAQPTVTLRSPTGDYGYSFDETTMMQTTSFPDGAVATRRVSASEQADVEAALRGAGWR